MEISQEEKKRIKQLLSARPIDKCAVKPASDVAVGCEFCTGHCVGSCESSCADLQEALPRPVSKEEDTGYDSYCEECGGNCYSSCSQGCGGECSGACRNSCYFRCGATCEFCCEGQCGVTVSSEPNGAVRKRVYDED